MEEGGGYLLIGGWWGGEERVEGEGVKQQLGKTILNTWLPQCTLPFTLDPIMNHEKLFKGTFFKKVCKIFK